MYVLVKNKGEVFETKNLNLPESNIVMESAI
jgi:hypothetical protein